MIMAAAFAMQQARRVRLAADGRTKIGGIRSCRQMPCWDRTKYLLC